jgi:nitrate/nitrite-specific signal transduction histidine kinase
MPRRGLRFKIITWSFVPTAIILVAVALATLYAYQRVTEDLVIQRDEDLARLSASQLASDLAQYSDLLSGLARAPGIVSGEIPGQQAALAAAGNRLLVFDGGAFLLNTFGQVVAAEPARPEILGQDWSDRDYFRQMLRSPKPVFSDIVGDGPGRAEVIVVAVPVTSSQGEFLGALCGAFRIGESTISALYGGIVKLRTREGGRAYVVDSHGRAIYHSESQWIGYDLSRLPAVQPVQAGQLGHLRTEDINSEPTIASFAPVPGTAWGLVTEQRWSALLAPSQRYRQFLLLLLGLGVVIPALVVAFGVRRITQPIMRMIVAAQEIAGGHFGQRIHVNTGDELEDLAHHFNRMAGQLANYYADLEGRVADRTRELAALNSIAAIVSRSLNLQEILRSSLTGTLEVMDLAAGGIFLVDPETNLLRLVAQSGLSPATVEALDGLAPGEGFAGRTVQSGEPVVMRDVAGDPRLSRPAVTAEGLRSLACVPLRSKGRVVGTLFVATRDYRAFSPQGVQLLTSIGTQVGVAVENARLYEQARQLAIMEERNRLARDLHDSVTQALYGVTLYADATLRVLPGGDLTTASEHVRQLRNTAQEALREMRLLIFELRPPVLQTEGLAAALLARLESVEARAGLKTEFRVEGDGHVGPEIEDGLYSIAREALNNTLKHAEAHKVRVLVNHEVACVVLEIADDGTGFDPRTGRDQGGLGLRGMYERAAHLGGQLEIVSAAGCGTLVRAQVPSNSAQH